jgi:hypothetical protein
LFHFLCRLLSCWRLLPERKPSQRDTPLISMCFWFCIVRWGNRACLRLLDYDSVLSGFTLHVLFDVELDKVYHCTGAYVYIKSAAGIWILLGIRSSDCCTLYPLYLLPFAFCCID